MFSFFLSRPTRLQDSDGEKSDQDLVVDIANETVSSIELVKNPKKKTFHNQTRTIKMHQKQSH